MLVSEVCEAPESVRTTFDRFCHCSITQVTGAQRDVLVSTINVGEPVKSDSSSKGMTLRVGMSTCAEYGSGDGSLSSKLLLVTKCMFSMIMVNCIVVCFVCLLFLSGFNVLKGNDL